MITAFDASPNSRRQEPLADSSFSRRSALLMTGAVHGAALAAAAVACHGFPLLFLSHHMDDDRGDNADQHRADDDRPDICSY